MNILVAKRLSFDQISVTISDYEFCFDDKIQKEIDAMRNKKVEESIQHGYEIWDGLNYYLQGYQEERSGLHFDFGTVRFRNISMAKFLNEKSQDQIKDNQAKGLYVAGIIKTNDNQYIFPRRSGRDITKAISQEISTISGMLQPDDNKIINFDGVRHHMKVELEEELGVKEQYITHGEFIGLTSSKAGNRGIIFYIELNINYDEVVQFFNQSNDGEMSEVIGIPSYQLEEFLTKQGFDDQGNYTTKLGLYRDIMQQTHLL